MRLSKRAILSIEESLSKGMMCEILSTGGGVVIRHHSHRADIDLPFPLLVKPLEEEPNVLTLCNRGQLLSESIIHDNYWILGIKGAREANDAVVIGRVNDDK